MIAGLMDGQAGISQSNLNVMGFAIARGLGLLVGQTILGAEVVGDFSKKRDDISALCGNTMPPPEASASCSIRARPVADPLSELKSVFNATK